MRILVPYDDSLLACTALHEACRILMPLDDLIVLAPVVIPRSVAVDASAGDVWRVTCRAEVWLMHAREIIARTAHFGGTLRCVRVQARSLVGATVAGATFYAADTIVIAERAGLRGRFAAFLGATAAIVRDAPCDVRVLHKVGPRRAPRTRDLQATIDVITGDLDADCPADGIGDEIARGTPSRDHEDESSYAD